MNGAAPFFAGNFHLAQKFCADRRSKNDFN
jgi:hypothetical protein